MKKVLTTQKFQNNEADSLNQNIKENEKKENGK